MIIESLGPLRIGLAEQLADCRLELIPAFVHEEGDKLIYAGHDRTAEEEDEGNCNNNFDEYHSERIRRVIQLSESGYPAWRDRSASEGNAWYC